MAERPLLLFPRPQIASRSNIGGGPGRMQFPSHQRQGERLQPMFNQLQTAFEARRVELQQTTAGIDPEQVLVIETIGGVEDFANAVRGIQGLEWMGELEVDELVPDEDFFVPGQPQKQLSGRLYLVMTNQRSLDEMLSLWRRYQSDPNMTFQRGLTKFRDVFLRLRDIRRWGIQDRLLETGILEAWQEDIRHDGGRFVKFETELWFRSTIDKRTFSQAQVSSLILNLGGQILAQCVIDGIAYHSILAELPVNRIQEIISNPHTELVKCDNIMFFRPVGQMSSGGKPAEGDFENIAAERKPLPLGDPVVAILDGLPLENHQLLANRLIIDDPDDWATDYRASERVHGTAMASLVVHGDLNDRLATPLSNPVYVRPIMKPLQNDLHIPHREVMPEDVLAVDLIHRAVKRIFEGENNNGPIAPTVKIINISIGDPTRQFAQSMSPLARLLDWLSVKYNVLFVISAGNHPIDICLGVSGQEFEQMQAVDRENAFVKAVYQDARLRKLLAPAESINGLTIGSVHLDNSRIDYLGDRIDPYENIFPSPVSAFGSGYRRAIKPDLVVAGGKQLYRRSVVNTNQLTFEPAVARIAPGIRVAAAGNLPGDTSATSYCCGTSNSAALVSRSAAVYYNLLLQILLEHNINIDSARFIMPLLKAMLVHGCTWGDIGSRIESILATSQNTRQISNLISRWLGYGIPQIDRIFNCTAQRVSILGFGQLQDGEANVFRLPLPPSLASRLDWRRLTVTLAWVSPVKAKCQKYRMASLWYELENCNLTQERTNADWRAVRRGTVQHEVFEGQRAIPFIDGESIGIKINCRSDANRITEPVPYGIAVSLEVSEGIEIPVYDEIRARILVPVQVRASEQAQS